MLEEEIFNKIKNDIKLIKPDIIIQKQFEGLKRQYLKKEKNIIHSFSQIKKNEEYRGLSSETLFFDDFFLYDIVIGANNIETHTVKLSNISKFSFYTTPNLINEKTSNSENSIVEYSSKLEIHYNENSFLYYTTSPEKYLDLLEISELLTKTILK